MLPLPIPPFTKNGILPVGIHDCDLNEIEAVFVHNRRRREIWNGFQRFLDLVRPIIEIDLIYVDGGFVTDKPEPKDVDIVIEYPDASTLIRLMNTHSFLADRDAVRDAYLVDVLPCLPQLPTGINDLRVYFQYVRPQDALERGLPVGSKKGILRISIQA